MKTPKFTDTHRWPNGYRRAAETDIRRTFARIRAKTTAEEAAKNAAIVAEQQRIEAENAAIAAEAAVKVAPLKRATK